MEEKNPIQVSERIFHTIECLANAGSMGLMELSQSLGLNKSTVHRILNSLMMMDYVRQDPDTLRYSLSYKFCSISNQILAHTSMIDIARPFLRKLADQTGETVHLVQIDGIQAVYIDKVESSLNSVRLISMVGKSIPLYCSGVGKALLADMNDNQIRQIWEQSDIQALTEHTVTDYSQFLDIIAQVRADGYSFDDEENEMGVRCIAVSLKDFHGKSHYAISISAPKDRMQQEQIDAFRQMLLEVKEQIQGEMGF